MRLDATAKCDEYNCWLTDEELDQLCRAAKTTRDDLIYQLGGNTKMACDGGA